MAEPNFEPMERILIQLQTDVSELTPNALSILTRGDGLEWVVRDQARDLRALKSAV